MTQNIHINQVGKQLKERNKMKVESVQDLIDILKSIKNKKLPIRLINEQNEDNENIWLHSIEISDEEDSGYEVEGEIRLIGNE